MINKNYISLKESQKKNNITQYTNTKLLKIDFIALNYVCRATRDVQRPSDSNRSHRDSNKESNIQTHKDSLHKLLKKRSIVVLLKTNIGASGDLYQKTYPQPYLIHFFFLLCLQSENEELQKGDVIKKIDDYDVRDLRHVDAQNLLQNSECVKLAIERSVVTYSSNSSSSSLLSSTQDNNLHRHDNTDKQLVCTKKFVSELSNALVRDFVERVFEQIVMQFF